MLAIDPACRRTPQRRAARTPRSPRMSSGGFSTAPTAEACFGWRDIWRPSAARAGSTRPASSAPAPGCSSRPPRWPLVSRWSPCSRRCTSRCIARPSRACGSTTASGGSPGLLSFYNSTFYRHYHGWHHRFTQIPGQDPELEDRKPTSLLTYVVEMSGVPWWIGQAADSLPDRAGTGRIVRIPQRQDRAPGCAIGSPAAAGLWHRHRALGGAAAAAVRDLLAAARGPGATAVASHSARRTHRLQPGRQPADQHAHDPHACSRSGS